MFIMVDGVFLVRLATVAISLSATVRDNDVYCGSLTDDLFKTMWAVLYGWTPEIFGPKGDLSSHLFSWKSTERNF